MSTESTESKVGPIGRRSMVRAGVWTVPAVSIATAAPAFAAASGSSDLTSSTCTEAATGAAFKVTVTLRNSGSVATEGLMVQVQATPGTLHATTAPGWKFSQRSHSGVSVNQIPAGGSLTSRFTVVAEDAATITLNFTTSNGGTFTCSFSA